MIMDATLIKEGDVLSISPKDGKKFSLAELQAAVGGYIEIVPLKNKKLMVVNEDGKIMGLYFNVAATIILRASSPTNDYIVGNALICTEDMI